MKGRVYCLHPNQRNRRIGARLKMSACKIGRLLRLGMSHHRAIAEAGAHACITAAAVHYGAEPTTATQELKFMLQPRQLLL